MTRRQRNDEAAPGEEGGQPVDQDSTNKTFNYGSYNNPEFDALIAKSYQERDQAVRMKTLHDAEALIMRDVPITPLVNDADPWLVSNKIKGFVENATNQHMTRFLTKE